MIQIERVYNGYIFRPNIGEAELFLSTQDLFDRLLLYFEGKSKHFRNDSYGKVIIELAGNEKSQ